MAMAIINGRRVEIPPTSTDEDVRRAGGIKPGRTLIKRHKEGNSIVPRGSKVSVGEGDVFIDAPARVKG